MNVAIVSYPTLFQSDGGLQVQVLETVASLSRRGCHAKIVDTTHDRLIGFDVIHVFAAINGNHRYVEWARSNGKSVVLSPLLRPHWTASFARRARWADWLVGRFTGWELKSEYRHMACGIVGADRCIALGPVEADCLVAAFGIDRRRVDVVPNGIAKRFFDADPSLFLGTYGLQPGFVLCAASINQHKNQLGLVKALEGSGLNVVLVGPFAEADRSYLEEVASHPKVVYAGSLPYDSPLLASAYAAAGVFCLPSMSEVMPLSVLEALAAGTPAVLTRHHCMDTKGMADFVKEIDPRSSEQIRAAILQTLEQGSSRERCSRSVAALSWDAVATSLLAVYRSVLGGASVRDAHRSSA